MIKLMLGTSSPCEDHPSHHDTTLRHPQNQVDSWEDELAANAEEDEHGGVLNQIAKDRELATKVENKHPSWQQSLLLAVLEPLKVLILFFRQSRSMMRRCQLFLLSSLIFCLKVVVAWLMLLPHSHGQLL